jgi:hypothetical protein
MGENAFEPFPMSCVLKIKNGPLFLLWLSLDRNATPRQMLRPAYLVSSMADLSVKPQPVKMIILF